MASASQAVLARSLWAVLLAGVASAIAIPAQTRSDRVAVVQQGDDLLLEVGSGAAGPADRIEIRLNKASARQPSLAFGPAGWKARNAGASIELEGPKLAQFPALFRIHIGNAKPPPVGRVVIWLAGETVSERDVAVGKLPPVTVSEGLEGLLAAPAIAVAGESALARVVLGEVTPPFGSWIVGDVRAVTDGDTVRLPIPPGAAGLLELPVRYVDAVGRVTVRGNARLLTEAARGSRPAPELQSVQPIALAGESLTVCGWFPPQSRGGVLLDGRPGLKLAAGSSRSLVYTLPEDTPPGRHLLSGDAAAGFSSRILELETIQLDTFVDRAMQPPHVRIKARGTTAPVRLRVVNLNPLAASLEGGNSQLVETDGGEENIAMIPMRPGPIKDAGATNLHVVFALAAPAPVCEAQTN